MKAKFTDEFGRGKAMERYGKPDSQTKYGVSQMKGSKTFARGGEAGKAPGYKDPNPIADIDPVGPPGETDMDFAKMKDENWAITKRVR